MRKVAIVGTAPLSKDMTPFDDPSYEIWVCSAGNMATVTGKRVTRWFELHALVELEAPENKPWVNQYIPWLKQQTFPVWMLEKNDTIPQAQIFPCRELLAEFGREWFTSSVAWMLAMAISEKVDHIAVYGVDMASDHEHYSTQRAGCRRFFEIAKERGIEIKIPWESCLGVPPPIYGLNESWPMGRRLTITLNMLAQKRLELLHAEEKTRHERLFMEGAIEQVRYMLRTFSDGSQAFDFMDLPKLESKPEPVKQQQTFDTSALLGSLGQSASRLDPPPAIDEPVTSLLKANGDGRVSP